MYFATIDVVNNTFDKTLDASFNFEEGETYTIKVADYRGNGVVTKTFVAEEVDPNEKDNTPKTGIENNIVYILLGTVVLASVSAIVINKKRSK